MKLLCIDITRGDHESENSSPLGNFFANFNMVRNSESPVFNKEHWQWLIIRIDILLSVDRKGLRLTDNAYLHRRRHVTKHFIEQVHPAARHMIAGK